MYVAEFGKDCRYWTEEATSYECFVRKGKGPTALHIVDKEHCKGYTLSFSMQ